MSMRRAALILLLLLVWNNGFAQENFTISKAHFLPPVYYVGDHVEARVRLSTSGGAAIAEPSRLPSPGSVHIHDIRIIPISDEYDVRISFSCYETGVNQLPPIELGDITMSGIEIKVESILQEGDTTVEGVFGPLLLPGTQLLIALLIGALLIVPPLAVLASIWLIRLIRRMLTQWNERKPLKDLNTALERLISSKPNSREFYIELTDILRNYLSRKLNVNIRSHTASELSAELTHMLEGVIAVENLAKDLSRFDEIKFGNRRAKRQQRNSDAERVREAALAIENWHREGQGHVDA